MSIAKDFFSQTRKPEGFLGKMMLGTMNSGHAKLADWGFTHLPAMTPENAVDLGCGGGRNAGELLKMFPKAHVTAVDYADLSVKKAAAYNRIMIGAGRCTAMQGILKPGGRFLIVNESDGMDKTGKQFETIIDGMHTYTAEELEAALQAAGFAQVKTAHHPQKPWLAILATKGE